MAHWRMAPMGSVGALRWSACLCASRSPSGAATQHAAMGETLTPVPAKGGASGAANVGLRWHEKNKGWDVRRVQLVAALAVMPDECPAEKEVDEPYPRH